MKAIWKGKVIAESDKTFVLESNHYFPREAINEEYFIESDTVTNCPWKGTASYFSVKVDEEVNQDSAWYYAAPKGAAKEIAGMVAFWRGVEVAS